LLVSGALSAAHPAGRGDPRRDPDMKRFDYDQLTTTITPTRITPTNRVTQQAPAGFAFVPVFNPWLAVQNPWFAAQLAFAAQAAAPAPAHFFN
jgi:hypothetical protein